MNKKNVKIIAIALCIFLISPLSIPFFGTKTIGELFEDWDEVLISYTDKPDSIDGKIETVYWKLVNYQEKQSKIKNVLNKYCYYSKIYKFELDLVEGSNSTLWIREMNGKDVIIFSNKNIIAVGNYVFIIRGGKKNTDKLIKEIVEIMES